MSNKSLTLSTSGLRKGGTLAALLGADEAPSNEPSNAPATSPSTPTGAVTAPAKPRTRTAKPAKKAASPAPTGGDAAFWAVGILEQTSIAVDPELLAAVEALRQDLSVPAATLFCAIVHAGLPADADTAADAVLLEQAEHPGRGREHNLRMPVGLKARLDELLKQTTTLIGKANRANLINAALRAGLPAGPDQARELFLNYQRQQTLARRAR